MEITKGQYSSLSTEIKDIFDAPKYFHSHFLMFDPNRSNMQQYKSDECTISLATFFVKANTGTFNAVTIKKGDSIEDYIFIGETAKEDSIRAFRELVNYEIENHL